MGNKKLFAWIHNVLPLDSYSRYSKMFIEPGIV